MYKCVCIAYNEYRIYHRTCLRYFIFRINGALFAVCFSSNLFVIYGLNVGCVCVSAMRSFTRIQFYRLYEKKSKRLKQKPEFVVGVLWNAMHIKVGQAIKFLFGILFFLFAHSSHLSHCFCMHPIPFSYMEIPSQNSAENHFKSCDKFKRAYRCSNVVVVVVVICLYILCLGYRYV